MIAMQEDALSKTFDIKNGRADKRRQDALIRNNLILIRVFDGAKRNLEMKKASAIQNLISKKKISVNYQPVL